jgi:hypothetical protein
MDRIGKYIMEFHREFSKDVVAKKIEKEIDSKEIHRSMMVK